MVATQQPTIIVNNSSSRLSNCYTPLFLPRNSSLSHSKQHVPDALLPRDSGDGLGTPRQPHGLRKLTLETSVVSQATGSSMVELGSTKVLCQVIGPVSSDHLPPSLSSSALSMDEGTLLVDVKYAPFGYPASFLAESTVSTLDGQGPGGSSSSSNKPSSILTTETDLSSRLLSAIAPVVPLQQFPKCAIVVQVTILQDDGGVLPVMIVAASLALADANLELYDLVTACSVAVIQSPPDQPPSDDPSSNAKELVLLFADPSLEEIHHDHTTAYMTLALLPNWKEVTVWEQSGRLSPAMANAAMELCRDGCRTLHRFMTEHFRDKK